MECNKEEAIRAKGIAESKMQDKDFDAAHKIALKAQQLYKDLENISQMLMVCDVHICADKKVFGDEKDWYAILKVEEAADEVTIKKQYRKFALSLHPDKNKFPGAESAFKLIGEAQKVLLDKGKRSLHDMKRKSFRVQSVPAYRPQPRPAYGPNVGSQRSNFASVNLNRQQTQQAAGHQGFSNGRATFWTACPFCNVKYQYYVEVMNKSLICQTCSKPFVAYESILQGAPAAANVNQAANLNRAANVNQAAFPQRRDVPSKGFSKVELGGQGNSSAEHFKTEQSQKKGRSNDFSQKVNAKRQRKREADSSESCDTDSSIEIEEDEGEFKAEGDVGSHERRRRSDRQKQRVSYKENLSDDEDFSSPQKKAKTNGCATEEVNRNGSKEDFLNTNNYPGLKDHSAAKQREGTGSLPNEFNDTKNVEGKGKMDDYGCGESSEAQLDSNSDASSKSTSEPELYDCPDPDFNDFDKLRSEGCFSTGQIWAVYDTLDAMPRFYVRIRKVFVTEFKLRITWLESDPEDEDETEWVNQGLPTSCGKFRNGSSDYTEDQLMFSHMVQWENGGQRDTYRIFPRKGEIWAVFKNWDIKWRSDGNPSHNYEYEFVEILAEYTKDVGARVAYLGKVKGFVSLFCRMKKEGIETFQIPPGELFRFSHMITYFELTGEERKGVPKGSFELDPASLPKSIEEITVPEDFVAEPSNCHPNGSCSTSSDKVKPEVESEGCISGDQADVKGDDLEPEVDNVHEDCSDPPATTPEAMEIPEPEFFNFDAEKSIEKFCNGQIWSLYSDEDGLPKYYCQIRKVASDQGFKVWLKWLTPCGLPNDVIRWHDKKMFICCGKFITKKGESQCYTSAACFSHQLTAEPTSKKNEFSILPRKGQVWALYKNWSPELKLSDMDNCQYEIVEVLEENGSSIKVSYLEQVDGFSSVFKVQSKEGSAEVPRAELLRFSNQIPAFRLTDERDGSLRGQWELDPAALPVHYFDRK